MFVPFSGVSERSLPDGHSHDDTPVPAGAGRVVAIARGASERAGFGQPARRNSNKTRFSFLFS
jgi:hypothetical protein